MTTSSFIFLPLFLLSAASAFNITKMLSPFPDLTTFNNLLTQTHLASEINSRQTITVLAVANSAAASLSGNAAAKKILSLHVVLDYYDDQKIRKLPGKTTTLTTLFQASGGATASQGFLNVSLQAGVGVAFGSAVKGSEPVAKLVKSVVSEPYNISVLEVSAAIVPSGLDGADSPAPEPTRKKKPIVPAPSPVPEKKKKKKPVVEAPAPETKQRTADGPDNLRPAADSPPSDESDGGKLNTASHWVAAAVIVGISMMGFVF